MAAVSSITYPAISAFASSHASADQQGKRFYLYLLVLVCFCHLLFFKTYFKSNIHLLQGIIFVIYLFIPKVEYGETEKIY